MANIFLSLLCAVLALRLILWKFFTNTDVFLNEVFFAALIIALALFWLLAKFIKRQPIAKSGLELPIFLLFVAAIFSLFHAVDFPSSLRGVLVLGSELAFFYMLLDVLDTPKRLRWTLIFLLGVAFVAALYGIKNFYILLRRPIFLDDAALKNTENGLYYLLGHRRAVSFFGWPNALAGFFLLILPLTLVLPFYLKLVWQKYLAAAIMFAVVVCFFYTFSFLTWLSFILSIALFLPFFWQKLGVTHWPKAKKRMVIYGLMFFVLFFILVIARKDFAGALVPRLFYYKAVFLLLGKNPLWGYGWDSFGILCRPLTEIRGNLSSYVHNSYLQIWLETGIVGFVGILLLVLRVLRFCHPRMLLSGVQSRVSGFPTETFGNDNVKTLGNDTLIFVAIAWGLVAFFIDNLFNFTLLAPNVAIYWWTMLAVFCAMAKMDSRQKHSGMTSQKHSGMTSQKHSGMTSQKHSGMTSQKHSGMTSQKHSGMTSQKHSGMTSQKHSGMTSQKHSGMTNVALRMTVFIILLVMFIVAARIGGGYMLFYKAMHLKRPGGYTSAFQLIDRAETLDPWSSYLPVGAGSLHLDMYGKTRIRKFLQMAAVDYLEAVDRSPKVYYNYFVLGKIFEALGDNVRSQLFTQKAKTLSPGEFALDNLMFHKSG